MRIKRSMVVIGLVILVLLVAVGSWYFMAGQNNESSTQTPSPATTSPSSSESPGAESTKTYEVNVYFSKHPESDDDPGATFPVRRTSKDLGLAAFAVAELLKGPTSTEARKGYFSTVKLREGESTCDGKDFSIRIANGLAQLQFCRPFDHLGVVADGQAESELKATLIQFDSINEVRILNSRGDCEFDLSGENKCLQ